jgi:uncharacterized protein YbjT (DUF2867 family)
MNLVVFGAGGKTGNLVVERAVAAGHLVTLFLREAPTQLKNPSIRLVTGDAGDLAAVRSQGTFTPPC